ncbi:hypothetical protein VT85_26180 (plasmid) [Planctomyces sp. SH-PL62]|nr:hypothetical protein VT85_26180 [Planctomyces sp. SH-PL62]
MTRIKSFVDACSFVLGATTLLAGASVLTPSVQADVDVGALTTCNNASCTCPTTPTGCGGATGDQDCRPPCGCRSGMCFNNP